MTEATPAGVEGRSLAPLMTGATPNWISMRTANRFTRAIIRLERAEGAAVGAVQVHRHTRPELYDLQKDPGEQTNIFDEQRQIADRMAVELARVAEETRARPGPSAVDPETRERLAALGYIGSFADTARREGACCPIRRTRSTSST